MNEKILKMRRNLKTLLEQVRAITDKEDMTAAEQTEANSIMAQIDELRGKIETEERAAKLTAELATNEPEQEERAALPKDETRAPRVEVIDTDKRYQDFGQLLQALARREKTHRQDPRLDYMEQRTLQETRAATGASEYDPAEGGFLVDKEMSDRLIERVWNTGMLAGMCDEVPIGPGKNGLKMNGVDETSRADGSRWGGVRGYWTNEAASMTGSLPRYMQISIDLEKLTALYYATDELLEDAPALGNRVTNYVTQELAFKLDAAIFRGTGSGQPLGIIEANCLVSVAAETNQTASTIVAENVIKMYSRQWNKSASVWLANNDTIPQLMTMQIAVGTGGIPIWLPGNQLQNRPYDTLMGRPIHYIEHASTVGTVGDLLSADMKQYLLIRKGGVQSAMSIHTSFTSNQTAFRFVMRCNGQPLWESAVTPNQGSNTLSPFVGVATRA